MRKLILLASAMAGLCMATNVAAQVPWTKAPMNFGVAICLEVADFNNDGIMDIVVFNGNKLNAWFQGPNWVKHNLQANPPQKFRGSIAVADFNGDGWMDIVMPEDNHLNPPGQLYLLENPGAGAVTGPWIKHTIYNYADVFHQNDMAIGDMDNDGKMDIIVKTRTPARRCILALQNNLNSWTVRSFNTGEVSKHAEGVAVGDVDNDGIKDIIISGKYMSPGAAGWRTGTPTYYTVDPTFANADANAAVKIAVKDINGDGKNDIYMGSCEFNTNYLAWYKAPANPHTSPWIKTVIQPNDGFFHAVQFGDIDKDGDLDLMTGRSLQGTDGVFVYYNNGNGSSWTKQTVDNTAGSYFGILKDLDGDGDLDYITPKDYNETVNIYYNQFGGALAQSKVNFSLSEEVNFDLDDAMSRRVKVFPNPTAHVVNIQLNDVELASEPMVDLISATGHKITVQLNSTGFDAYSVPVSEIPDGVYVVSVKDTEKVILNERIVIKH